MRINKKGFTLAELLITFSILAFYLCGILLTYINMLVMGDLSRDITLVTTALGRRMEEIKNTNFDSLSLLNGTTFDISGFSSTDAKGSVEVCDNTTCPAIISYADLKRVRLVASFRSRGRIIGEDRNLNGVLDTGEDVNGNERLDSPIELITLISR